MDQEEVVHIFRSQQCFEGSWCLISDVTVIFVDILILRQVCRELQSQTQQGLIIHTPVNLLRYVQEQ